MGVCAYTINTTGCHIEDSVASEIVFKLLVNFIFHDDKN